MDVMHLERCASQLHLLAGEARAGAVRVADVGAVEWRSLAADRFRALLHDEAARGRQCAELLEEAAQAFAAHARAIGAAPAEVPGVDAVGAGR
jgi:hypothetical protein